VFKLEELTKAPEKIWSDMLIFPWWILLLWGILALLIGIAFLATPGITTVLFITFLGLYWFIGGLFTLGSVFIDKSNRGWKIFLAIISIIAGIIILLYPLYSTVFVLSFFVIFIGFYAIFIGCAHLFQSFSKKDAGLGVLGILSLIFGIILLCFPLITAALIPFIAGILALVFGVASIFTSIGLKKEQGATTI